MEILLSGNTEIIVYYVLRFNSLIHYRYCSSCCFSPKSIRCFPNTLGCHICRWIVHAPFFFISELFYISVSDACYLIYWYNSEVFIIYYYHYAVTVRSSIPSLPQQMQHHFFLIALQQWPIYSLSISDLEKMKLIDVIDFGWWTFHDASWLPVLSGKTVWLQLAYIVVFNKVACH